MDIQLIADSCCDVTPKLAGQIGLVRVPLKITIDGNKHFVDDEHIDIPALLEAMKKTREPLLTAAPSPESYAAAMRQADASVVVTLSSRLSGSYGAAMAARGMVLEESPEKKIAVFDSKSASAGETRIALRLFDLIRKGAGFEAICEQMPAFIGQMRTLFVLEDLRTLIKNGRIPRMTGMLGTVLMFRPIMGEDGEGEIVPVEKIRGTKKALARLVEIIAERTALNAEKSLLMTISECDCPARAVELKRNILAHCPAIKKVFIAPTGGLSTSYANSGGIVVAYG
ncbi:MAG: DegV family protein [Oscillospiraceae bacterium]